MPSFVWQEEFDPKLCHLPSEGHHPTTVLALDSSPNPRAAVFDCRCGLGKSLICEMPSFTWQEEFDPKLCYLPTEEEYTESSDEMTERHTACAFINGSISMGPAHDSSQTHNRRVYIKDSIR